MVSGSGSSTIEDGKRAQTTIEVVFNETASHSHRLATQGWVARGKEGEIGSRQTGEITGETGSEAHGPLRFAVDTHCPPAGEAESLEILSPTTCSATAQSRRHSHDPSQLEQIGAYQIATATTLIQSLQATEEEQK
jgi:hypothetical protein